MIWSWIKCHIFGRHVYSFYVQVKNNDLNTLIVQCECKLCDFVIHAFPKLTSIEKTIKHLTLIERV